MRKSKTYSDSDSEDNDDLSSSSSDADTEDDDNDELSGSEKALQLISLERSNDVEDSLRISLNTDVLETVLESCQEYPICVISIIGHSRCGKSFILNYIKERLSTVEMDEDEENWLPNKTGVVGFNWKHGYKPVTKGIWIWSRAFIIEGDGQKVAVLLLDTEGFNDESTTAEEISAILGISLLSSSITIINLNGDIPEDVFDWLSPFTKFGNLSVKKGIQKPFQKLSLLVRDWTRLSEYPFGGNSSDKIFKSLLSSRKDGSQFKKSWEDYACYLLPNIGSKALQSTFQGNSAELNKEFLKRIVTYISELTNGDNLNTKHVFGNELGPKEFKIFLTAYANMFNDGGLDLEAGIKPETLLTVTAETIAKIKLDYGVNEYRRFYRDLKKQNFDGYLRDTFIDGMHVQAKDRAIEAFKKMRLTREEDEQLKLKLENLLEKENQQLKRENEGAKRSQVAENIGKACEAMRNELASRFPFTAGQGSNIPESMVFYDNGQMTEILLKLSNHQKDTFLEEFADEDEEGMRKLTGTIESVLEPIVNGCTKKNQENRQRAEHFAQNEVENLKAEYMSSMQATLKTLPEMEPKTLLVFHTKEIKGIEEKFKLLNFGTPAYQRKFFDELMEAIENEHENMVLNLDATMAKVLHMVSQEAENYTKVLKEKAEEMETEEEITRFHEDATAVLLRRFHSKIPFPEDSARAGTVLLKLETSLRIVLEQEIQQGVTRRRKMEEKVKEEGEASFSMYQNSMKISVDENEFLDADEFQQISKMLIKDAHAHFVRNTENIPPELKVVVDEEKESLSRKLMANEAKWKVENEQRKDSATCQADTIFGTILNKYKLSMLEAAGRLKTIDELVMEHTKWKDELAEDFKKQCISKKDAIVHVYTQNFFEAAEKEFDGVKEFFNKSLQSENASVMTALLNVKTEYVENMNTEFRNKNGYFGEDELDAMHKAHKKTALKKLTGDPPLSKVQKKEVEKKLDEAFLLYKEKNDLVLKSFENNDPAIGIDLGTTYCCVAIYLNGRVQIVRNSTSGLIVPSYVRINDDETKIFGQPAKDQAYKSPEATIYDAKRMIGRRFDDKELVQDRQFWPFTVVEENGAPKVEVNGKKYFPEEISSFLLKHLKEEAESTMGIKIQKAVVTVPAYFTDGQRQATINAGKMAGLEVLGILNEPTAAALAYRLDNFFDDKIRNVLVFDLGGGTFDVAILEMSKDNINVKSVHGDDHLGGDDFDKSLMNFCAKEFKTKTGIDLFKDKDSTVKTARDDARRRLRRLQTSCEEAKKALSAATSTIVSIAAFVGTEDLIVEITRKIFEEVNDHLFLKTIQTVDDALQSAKLGKKEIDEIVLVGGSTRILKLQRMLRDHFNGKALSKRIDPDQAVAYGAAVQAAIKCAKPNVQLFDFRAVQEVTPMSLGIEMANKQFDIIIPRNSKIPAASYQEYQTNRDGQTNAWIRIFQGEKEKAADNKLLGEFTLEGIPYAKAGEERVKVTMHYDENLILNIKASCSNGEKEMTVREENSGIMDKETVKRKTLESKQ